MELAGLRNLTRVCVRVESKAGVGEKRKREGEEEEEEGGKLVKKGKEERRTPLT